VRECDATVVHIGHRMRAEKVLQNAEHVCPSPEHRHLSKSLGFMWAEDMPSEKCKRHVHVNGTPPTAVK
jgi:hypothetical protein